MNRPFYRRHYAAAVMLLLALAPARLAAAPAPGKAGIQFSCMVWEHHEGPTLFYRDGEAYLPLKLRAGNRSQLYPLKNAHAFELFVAAVDSDGKPIYNPVGRAALVAGTGRMLFMIDPLGNPADLKFRVIGMDDALETFPPGTFRFANFTTTPLQVKFGGQVNPLPAAGMKVVKSNVSAKGGFLPFILGNSTGKIVFETRLFGQPTGRDIVFIGGSSTGGEIKVKFLTEIIPPEVPEPKG
ncbi:MAG: hypothetical protein WED15_04340 [Akkermansiaceae bacterium]